MGELARNFRIGRRAGFDEGAQRLLARQGVVIGDELGVSRYPVAAGSNEQRVDLDQQCFTLQEYARKPCTRITQGFAYRRIERRSKSLRTGDQGSDLGGGEFGTNGTRRQTLDFHTPLS